MNFCFRAVYTPNCKYMVPTLSQRTLESSTMKKSSYSNMSKCGLSLRLKHGITQFFSFSQTTASFSFPSLPQLWHSNWLFTFIIGISLSLSLFNHCPLRLLLWFSANAQDGRKCLGKCTTYSSHFAKGRSSVSKVVRENDRELHVPVRNCFLISSSIFRNKSKTHVLSSFQTIKKMHNI